MIGPRRGAQRGMCVSDGRSERECDEAAALRGDHSASPSLSPGGCPNPGLGTIVACLSHTVLFLTADSTSQPDEM